MDSLVLDTDEDSNSSIEDIKDMECDDECDTLLIPVRKVTIEPVDEPKFNFDRTLLVYTTKLEEMSVFNKEIEYDNIKNLLDDILFESLPKTKNKRPYIARSIRLQKKMYNEMIKKLKIIRQKSKFLTDLSDGFENCNVETIKEMTHKTQASLYEALSTDNATLPSRAIKDNSVILDNVIGDATNLNSNEIIDIKSEPHFDDVVYEAEMFSSVIDTAVNVTSIARCPRNSLNNVYRDSEPHIKIEDLCKPVSVVLKDFRKKKSAITQEMFINEDDRTLGKFKPNKIDESSKYNVTESSKRLDGKNKLSKITTSHDGQPEYLGVFKQFIRLLPDSKKDLSVPKYESPLSSANNKIKKNKTNQNTLVKISNVYSKDIDLYCINETGGLIDYYKANKNNLPELLNSCPEFSEILSKEICCWHKREEYIKSIGTKRINAATQKILRKPHGCSPGKCKCCCKKYDSDSTEKNYTLEDKKLNDLENKISKTTVQTKEKVIDNKEQINSVSLKGLLTKQWKPPNTLIDRAMVFEKCKSQKKTHVIDLGEENSLRNRLIQIKDLVTDQMELYELGDKGEIITHFKYSISKFSSAMAQKLLDVTKPKITGSVCCWVKRELIISKLIAQGISLNVVNFIRTSHACSDTNCTCCCSKSKFEKKGGLRALIDIDLPKRPAHTRFFTKNIEKSIKSNLSLNKDTKSTDIPAYYKLNFLPMKTNNVNKDVTQPKAYPNNHNQVNLNKQDKSILNLNILDKNNVDHNYKIDIMDIMTQNLEKIIDTPEVPAGVDSSCVRQCISTILDTFKGVRLTINNEGKVAAALNAPVNSLTTSELRVLASIISCAQTQVDSLGLLPGSKTAKTFITQTTTAETSITQTTTSETSVSRTTTAETSITQTKTSETATSRTTTAETSITQTTIAEASISQTTTAQTSNKKVSTVKIPSQSFRLETSNKKLIGNNFSINLTEKPSRVTLSTQRVSTFKLTTAPNLTEKPPKASLLTQRAPIFKLSPTPKPSKLLVESFANYLSTKKQNFQDSFLSYTSPSVNTETITPIIENVFSLKSVVPAEDAAESKIDWYKKPSNTHETNEYNVLHTTADKSTETGGVYPLTNVMKTYGVKRKEVNKQTNPSKRLKVLSPSELVATPPNDGNSNLMSLAKPIIPPLLYLANNSESCNSTTHNVINQFPISVIPQTTYTSNLAIQSVFQETEPLANIPSKQELNDVSINNISNVAPAVLSKIHLTSKNNNFLHGITPNTNILQQNNNIIPVVISDHTDLPIVTNNLSSIFTSPSSQVVQFVTQPVLSASGPGMLLISPMTFTSQVLSSASENNQKALENNKTDPLEQLTNNSETSSFNQPMIDVTESDVNIKEEEINDDVDNFATCHDECILGV